MKKKLNFQSYHEYSWKATLVTYHYCTFFLRRWSDMQLRLSNNIIKRSWLCAFNLIVWKWFENVSLNKMTKTRTAAFYFLTNEFLLSSRTGWHIFKKYRNHPKILGAIREIWNEIHTEDPQILEVTVKYLVARAISHLWSLHPYSGVLIRINQEVLKDGHLSTVQLFH